MFMNRSWGLWLDQRTKAFGLLVGLFLWGYNALGQLHVVLDSVPSYTPAGATIYLAGSFNNWNPSSAAHALTWRPDSTRALTLPAGSGTLAFKFTRGSWASVEGNASGSFRPNRTYTYGNGDTVRLKVLSWEDLHSGSGGGGGGGYLGGLGGSLKTNLDRDNGGNGGSAGQNFSAGLIGASATYSSVSGGATVTFNYQQPALTLTDATVMITGGFLEGDTLSLAQSYPGPITAQYNSQTGILRLSGSGNLTVWQT
ncbi:MAG: hypothetical protein EBR22_01925, partial [Cytophagia bacterium]|nr:hypothetical protein [Cytophagia bacterium]